MRILLLLLDCCHDQTTFYHAACRHSREQGIVFTRLTKSRAQSSVGVELIVCLLVTAHLSRERAR